MLSDRDPDLEQALATAPHPMRPERTLPEGLLVIELAWPPMRAGVLLDWQLDEGAGHTLSVFHDPAVGIVVLHRAHGRVLRHGLPGPLPARGPTARLTLGWSVAADLWSLTLAAADRDCDAANSQARGIMRRVEGRGPLAPGCRQLAAMCDGRGLRRRDPSVLWFGLTDGTAPPPAAPWIGLQTPIDTPRGPVAAGHLRVGDRVMTVDHGPLPVMGLRRFELPGRGAEAPVLLRAPWFARQADLLVSADQPVILSGDTVEYLFGEDAVLVPAGALVDGRAALCDNRRAVVAGVSLDLGCGALIAADGCLLATAHHGPAHLAPPSPRRRLTGRDAAPLLANALRGGMQAPG